MTNVVLYKFALSLLFSSFSVYSTHLELDEKITPQWSLADIKSSNIQFTDKSKRQEKIQEESDIIDVFIVTIRKGFSVLFQNKTFKLITPIKTQSTLQEEIKFSPDGRFIYFSSADGWIKKYDTYNLKMISKVRSGIHSSNLALSSDGKYAIVGNTQPHNIVIFDTESLSPIKIINTTNKEGISSRVSAVYNAPLRYSFIVSLQDIKEVWEIPYSDKGGVDIYKGWAHDYRKDGGEGKLENWKVEKKFPIRRIQTDDFLDDLSLDKDNINLIGMSRNTHKIQAINLDVKKKVATLEFTGTPKIVTSLYWNYKGKDVFAFSNGQHSNILIIDMENWEVIKEVEFDGSNSSIMSNNNSYLWVKVFNGLKKEIIYIINKNSLEVVKTIRPDPNEIITQIKFTSNGKYVLVNTKGNEANLNIFDTQTLEKIKTLSMKHLK